MAGYNPYERLSGSELNGLVERAMVIRLTTPSDRELFTILTEHGMDRRSASMMFQNGGLREIAIRFWADTVAAKRGDPDAIRRVESIQEVWSRERVAA